MLMELGETLAVLGLLLWEVVSGLELEPGALYMVSPLTTELNPQPSPPHLIF